MHFNLAGANILILAAGFNSAIVDKRRDKENLRANFFRLLNLLIINLYSNIISYDDFTSS